MDPVVCPLLRDSGNYNPDTIDLVNNLKERSYWLTCFENMVKKFIKKAPSLNPDDPSATQKAEICAQKFHNLVAKAADDHRYL